MISGEDIEAFESLYGYWGCDYGTRARVSNMTIMAMVQEFATKTEQTPQPYLYAALIGEEGDEWRSEYLRDTKEEQLKELADLVYVVYGFANSKGWDLDEAVRRVHINNVGRCIQPDGSIQRRADGKILKNPDYPKVNLKDLV
jgi:NTP pyrophosphatase (non-canonical NTP hydrolase)